MKVITNIIRWIGVSVFGIMAIGSLGSGGFLGALLFVLGGALIAPIGVITKLRHKLKLNKALSIVLAVVLLFGGVFAMPVSDVPNDTNISETVSDDTSKEESTDTAIDKNTDSSSKKDDTSKTEDKSSKEETTSKTEDSSSKEENNSKPNETQTATCSHANTSVKNKSNATCTENGYSGDTYCNSCNKVIQSGSQVNATGHNTEIRNQKSATTTSEGYTGDTYCKTCGIKVASGQAIPKIVDNTQQETNSQTVYTTATGKKYHSTKNCSGLSNANAIYDSTLEDAKNQGLTPCSKCH